jgi:omega-3 fatty acid desaturase (delta-15 desaturase)
VEDDSSQATAAVTSANDEKTVNNNFIDIPAMITSMDIDNIATFDQHINGGATTKKPPPPSLGTIMKMLPASTFDVSTPTSLLYFILDVSAVLLCMTALTTVIHTNLYHNLPLIGQALTVLPIQLVTGFAMWCTWCIGHDAGHGTVSKDIPILNRIVGEICHSIICLTPYVPWQLSHLKHHLNHNHLTKDYSHQWYIKEKQEEQHIAIQLAYTTRMIFLPFLYFVYLVLGIPDGGHVYFYGRMWEGTTMKEKLNASLSVITSLVTSGVLWHSMGTTDFTIVCMVPWLVMSFWLFMVTYLQHHSKDGKLYTDETFTFTSGAFETVDRDYGKYINRLSHHMMDGHVVHHLFFTKVPHYRLEVATEALQVGLRKNTRV